jgi:hypothetical protein
MAAFCLVPTEQLLMVEISLEDGQCLSCPAPSLPQGTSGWLGKLLSTIPILTPKHSSLNRL